MNLKRLVVEQIESGRTGLSIRETVTYWPHVSEVVEALAMYQHSICPPPSWIKGALSHVITRATKREQHEIRALVRLLDSEPNAGVNPVPAWTRMDSDPLPVLGEGTGGVVYAFDEDRAIKAFTNPGRIPQRMMHERNVLTLLRHDHLVRGFSAWVYSDCCYVEMERAPHGSLLNALPRASSVGWIAHQLMSAVDCLRAHRLVHGDVRPANVLVFGPRLVKLCDFELVVKYDAAENEWYDFESPGVCSYPPEMYGKRAPLDHLHKVDWWGVGCVLYSVLHADWDAEPYSSSQLSQYVESDESPEPPYAACEGLRRMLSVDVATRDDAFVRSLPNDGADLVMGDPPVPHREEDREEESKRVKIREAAFTFWPGCPDDGKWFGNSLIEKL